MNELLPHQQRVVTEFNELNDKIEKLRAFVEGVIYSGLPIQEQSLLTAQLSSMITYATLLSLRINSF